MLVVALLVSHATGALGALANLTRGRATQDVECSQPFQPCLESEPLCLCDQKSWYRWCCGAS